MKEQKNISIQRLTESEELSIGYSDDDIVIVDSIQRFTEVKATHLTMNSIITCTNGKVQGLMNNQQIQLEKNQVAIVPENFMITDVMVSPDFDMKGMFFTNRILQSFLREKMYIWNDMMYIHRLHIISMNDEDLMFYTHFHDMLSLCLERGRDNPFRIDIIQSLLRSAILGMCGSMKRIMPATGADNSTTTPGIHFQNFLDLLHDERLNPHTVEAYASRLCISPKYLTAICKKLSGKPANEWIREKVLEDIRYYLRQTDLSVKQVASEMGFPNPSFFGKYVKEHFGMTPLQYRQQRN